MLTGLSVWWRPSSCAHLGFQPGSKDSVLWPRGRSYGLAGVRETARAQPELKFTSLLHHVSESLLREAFFDLKKTAAVGIDEVTWHDYEQGSLA